jgi:hypothetical protein
MFLTIPNSATKGPLIQTLLIVAALSYFLRKDIFNPYMKLYKRGWRFLKRYPPEKITDCWARTAPAILPKWSIMA